MKRRVIALIMCGTIIAETVLILTGMALCAGALAQFVKLVQRLMEGTRAAS